MLGRSIGQLRQFKTSFRGDHYGSASSFHRSSNKVPTLFTGVKSKAEAKRRFRDAAFSAHPDRAGGSEEKMKKINQDWQNFQKHPKFPKTAMASFVDELMQIWRR